MHSRITSGYSRRQRGMALLVGATVGLVLALLYLVLGPQRLPLVPVLDRMVFDSWQQAFLRGEGRVSGESSLQDVVSPQVSEKLVVVVVDDATLAHGLPWPLPRSMYLDLVRRLEKAGARTIGIDVLFGSPGPDPRSDLLLARALAHPSVVVPCLVDEEGGRLVRRGHHPPLLQGWSPEDLQHKTGFLRERPDPDGVIRQTTLSLGSPQDRLYSFETTLLAHFQGIPPAEVVARTRGLHRVRPEGFPGEATAGQIAWLAPALASPEATLGLESLPAGTLQVLRREEPDEGEAPIRSLADHLVVVPLHQVLEAREEDLPGFFGTTGEGTPNEVLALVGVVVSGGHDLQVSPLGPFSGTALHVNVLANLIQDNFLREVPRLEGALEVLALALLATILGATLETRAAGLVLVLVLTLLYEAGRSLYAQTWLTGAQLLPVAFPGLAAAASFLAVAVYAVQAQKESRDRLARILQEVAPIPDLEALLGRQGLAVGSEERDLTLLISDIRGYTDLAEGLDPVAVSEMLNEYHQALGEVFERYGGVVFGYQGDAQTVVFGLAPTSQPNHAAAACRAGAAMKRRLGRLREEWRARGRPVFETGIGICSGPVAVGVMGSATRKQYVAVGDALNTAARMQGRSGELGWPVLLTRSTLEEAGDAVAARPLGTLRLKGKREPLEVFGLDVERMAEKMGLD